MCVDAFYLEHLGHDPFSFLNGTWDLETMPCVHMEKVGRALIGGQVGCASFGLTTSLSLICTFIVIPHVPRNTFIPTSQVQSSGVRQMSSLVNVLDISKEGDMNK